MTLDQAIKELQALKKKHGGDLELVKDNTATHVPYAITEVRFIEVRNVKKLEAHEAVPKLWNTANSLAHVGRKVIYVRG